MERGQFYHYETYARLESKSKQKEGSSIYSILGEAFREPDYSTHVKKIDTDEHPPEIVFTDMSFDEGLKNDEKLKKQKTYLIELAESYAKAKQLKMKDNCILAGVVSYPPGTTQDMLFNLRDKLVLPFLKKKWGDNLRCVIGHNDEYFWDDETKTRETHYQDHFYVIPDAQGNVRITELHAGKAAKNMAIDKKIVFEEENGLWIDEKGKIVMKGHPLSKKEKELEKTKKRGNGKRSDRAYRDAMRLEQDEFFEAVGEPAGWERTTVKGVRYSRKQVKAWKQNQREMEAQQKTIKEEAERSKSEAAAEKERLIKECQEESERIKSEAAAEKERLIKESQEKTEKIKTEAINEAQVIKADAQNIKDAAFETGNIIINSADKTNEDKLMKFNNDEKEVYSILKVDLEKSEVPQPERGETGIKFYERIKNWLKVIVSKKARNEKKIKKMKLELDKQRKVVDHQLYVLCSA